MTVYCVTTKSDYIVNNSLKKKCTMSLALPQENNLLVACVNTP
jgi:hypothetical protein